MTYEEYFELVKKGFEHYAKPYDLTDEQIVEFLKNQEDVIKERFEIDKEAFDKGEITIDQFKIGSVEGVTYTLNLMY
jgi:hypothetical protein